MRLGALFEAAVGTVDGDLPPGGIDEPAEAGAVGAVLLHLSPGGGTRVGRREQLDDEVGAQRQESLLVLGREPGKPVAEDPGRIRRTYRTVGQLEAGRGVEGDAGPMLFGPAIQGGDQETVPRPRFPADGRHHRDAPFRVALDPHVLIQLAELEELLAAHVDGRGHVQLQGRRAVPLLEDHHDLRLPHAARGNQRSGTGVRPMEARPLGSRPLTPSPSTDRSAGHGVRPPAGVRPMEARPLGSRP